MQLLMLFLCVCVDHSTYYAVILQQVGGIMHSININNNIYKNSTNNSSSNNSNIHTIISIISSNSINNIILLHTHGLILLTHSTHYHSSSSIKQAVVLITMLTVAITGAIIHFVMIHLITEELIVVVTGMVGTVISSTITAVLTVMHLIELEVVHSIGGMTIVHRHEVQEMKLTQSVTRQPNMSQ
jgi:hypothetical protein